MVDAAEIKAGNLFIELGYASGEKFFTHYAFRLVDKSVHPKRILNYVEFPSALIDNPELLRKYMIKKTKKFNDGK